jgi:sugar phosphate permease
LIDDFEGGRPLTNENGAPDRWWILTFVALAYFVLILHRSVIFYVQVPLSLELTLSKTQAGMLDTAFIIPYGLAQLFVAYLGDRIRRRTVLCCSLLASAVALAAMGFVHSYVELFGWRIVLGLTQAASVPAIAGVMADCFTPRNRSTAVGIYFVSLNLAFVVAGKYGGAFADMSGVTLPLDRWGFATIEVSGWRLAMLVFAALGAVMALLVGLFMREPERTERRPGLGLGTEGSSLWRTILSVVTVRSYLVVAAVYVLYCVMINTQDFWLARYFVESFKMTNEQAGQFATIWSRPSTIVGLLLGGFLADRCASRWRVGRTWVQIIGIAVGIPALYVLGTSGAPGLLAAAMVIIGLGSGFYVANLWTTTFEVIDPAARSTAVGLLNVVGTGAAPAAPLVGYLADQQILGIGQSIAGLSIFAGAIVVLLLFNLTVFLRHDYRGPLSGGSPQAT